MPIEDLLKSSRHAEGCRRVTTYLRPRGKDALVNIDLTPHRYAGGLRDGVMKAETLPI